MHQRAGGNDVITTAVPDSATWTGTMTSRRRRRKLKVNADVVVGAVRFPPAAVATTGAATAAAGGLYNVETEPIVVRRLQRIDDRRNVVVVDVR